MPPREGLAQPYASAASYPKAARACAGLRRPPVGHPPAGALPTTRCDFSGPIRPGTLPDGGFA